VKMAINQSIDVEMVSLVKPLYLIGRGSWPLGPPRPPRSYKFPYSNVGKPLIPPIKPPKKPFNYLEYVNFFDPNVKVRIFKATSEPMVK
jgi:hypothetical protein